MSLDKASPYRFDPGVRATARTCRSVPSVSTEALIGRLAGGVEGGTDHGPGVAGRACAPNCISQLLLGLRHGLAGSKDPTEVDCVPGWVGLDLDLVQSCRVVVLHARKGYLYALWASRLPLRTHLPL